VIGHYFGYENQIEDAERFAQWTELARVHVAFEGDRPIGVTGAFSYGCRSPAASLFPRRGSRPSGPADASPARRAASTDAGAARRLPRARRPRSVPLGLGGTIYGRYGYGLASRIGSISLPREHTGFAVPFQPRGTVRIVDFEESARAFPPLYEQVFAQRPV